MADFGAAGPILKPILQAMRIKDFFEQRSHEKEQREMQREAFKLHLDQTRRSNAAHDFATYLHLRDQGWVPEGVGKAMEGPLEEEFGPFTSKNEAVPTPIGKFFAPTQASQDARAEREAEREGKVAGIKKKAEEAEYDPTQTVDMSSVGGPSDLSVPRSKAADTWIKIYEKKHPNLHVFHTEPGDGSVHIFGVNPQSQEVKDLGTQKGGKVAKSGAEKEPLPSNAEVEAKLKEWRTNAYNAAGITQEDQDIASGKVKYDPKSKTEDESEFINKRKAAQSRIHEVEKEMWGRATEAVKADIRNKTISGQKGKAKPYAGKAIAEKDIPEAAKHHGMSEELWRTEFEAGGGTVTP